MARPPVLYAKVTERDWTADVRRIAALFGWLAYHTWDSQHSAAGFPDMVLVRGRRLVFAELKTTTGKLTPAQEQWLTHLRLTEAEVYVWRPEDVLEVTEILRGE